ncbi:MAG: putative porin, partial [Candidatus Acidiferrales bacterium]
MWRRFIQQRKAIAVALALALGHMGFATSVVAGDAASSGDTAPSAKSADTTAKSAKETTPTADANSPVMLELQELKEAVQAQTKQFDEHSRELESERTALQDELAKISAIEAKLGVTSASPEPVIASNVGPDVSVTPQATGTQAQTPQDWSNRIANLEDRFKEFGPFSFSGDFRLRDEPFFGGPANQSLDQNRERFRFRLNLDAKLNDDFSGGFSLASGDINDPTSTNQTITGFYTRKAIAIDKAFLDYTPHQFHALTLTGGKFGYPWYNTELTWDKDLNPEGAAETLAFDLHSTPMLKKIALVGFQLPFTQVAGVSTDNQSLVMSAVYG